MSQEMHDDLRHLQALLSRKIPSGDVTEVLGVALKECIASREKHKFPATDRPRMGRRRPSTNPRYIPSHVKRAVWERDEARCTFVSETGQRCEARKFLEFDHVDPVARSGRATVQGIRQTNDVRACLRELGFRADQTRRAVEYSAAIPDATLEGRVRAALQFLCPKTRVHGRVGSTPAVPM